MGGGECCSLRRLWGTSLPSFRGCWRPWACGRISPGSAPAFTWPSPRVAVFPDKYTSRAAWRATLTQQNLISTEFICKTLFPNRHIHGPQGLGLEYTFWGSRVRGTELNPHRWNAVPSSEPQAPGCGGGQSWATRLRVPRPRRTGPHLRGGWHPARPQPARLPLHRLLNQTNGNQFQEQSLFFQVPITNVCIFRGGNTQASRNRDSTVPSGALPSGAYLTHRWAQPGGVDGGRRGLGHPGQQEAGPCRSGAGWVVTSIVKL